MNQGKQGADQGLIFQLLHEIGKLSTEAHERGVLYIDENRIAKQLQLMNVVGAAASASSIPIKHSSIDAVATYTASHDAKLAVHASSNNITSDKILADAVITSRDYSLTTTNVLGNNNCGQVSASFLLVHGSTIKFSSIGSNPIVAFNIDKESKRTSVTLVNDLDFPGELPPVEIRNEKKLDITKFSTIIVIANTTTNQKQGIDFHDFTYIYNALIKKGLLAVDTYQYLPTGTDKYWVSDDLINAIEKELLRTKFALQVTQLYNGQPCTQFFLNPEAKENLGEWKYRDDTVCVGIFDYKVLHNSTAKTLSYLNGVFNYCLNSNSGTFNITSFQLALDSFFFSATSTLFTIDNANGTFFLSLFKGEKVPFLVVMGSDPAEEAAVKLRGALPAIFGKTEFVDLQPQASTSLATAASSTTTTSVDMSASTLNQLDDFVFVGDDKSAVASK